MAWVDVNANFKYQADQISVGGTSRTRLLVVAGRLGSKTSRTVTACSVLSDGKTIPNMEAGHLVPLELGGADFPFNLVPMFGGVNRGTYRAVEKSIGNAMSGAGSRVMVVKVSYPTVGYILVPEKFDVSFYANLPDMTQYASTTPTLGRQIANAADAAVTLDVSNTSDAKLRSDLMAAKAKFDPTKWKIENNLDYSTYGNKLPPVQSRPNAWIDWVLHDPANVQIGQRLLAKLGSTAAFTVGPNWPFHVDQRRLIVIANQMTQPDPRKGQCWSDASDDPVTRALTYLGTDDGIQIDHIVPSASQGPNVYSNAQVTSALYNKSKGRTGAVAMNDESVS